MNAPNLTRWAAFLVLAIAASPRGALAADAGAITVTGTFKMDEQTGTVGSDLAAVLASGADHTWTLTMRGTTSSRQSWTSTAGGMTITNRVTTLRSTSFDLQFSGPDASTLNQVAGGLVGGEVRLQLRNAYYSSGGGFADVNLLAVGPDDPAGVSFWAGHELMTADALFPADANGYPVVGPDPDPVWIEGTYLIDNRGGTSGAIVSWGDTAEFSGDMGTPRLPALRIRDGSVVEGNRGKARLALYVTLDGASAAAVTVSYRTVDGSALAQADYSASTGTLTFDPGETTKRIAIRIRADRATEPDETFAVELFDAAGATIGDGTAVATIRNDD